MTRQLRDIVENALVARQAAGATERAEAYDTVRQRLDRYIAGRSPVLEEEQKTRLLAALERTIAEIEEQFSPQKPAVAASHSQHATPGETHMATPLETDKPRKSSGGRNVALAAVAVAVLAGVGGWYWWSQQVIECVVGSEAARPLSLHNVAEVPEGLAVTGEDPRIVLTVPSKQSRSKICLRVQFTSSRDDTLEIFLPDPNASQDGFAAGRSIRNAFSKGTNDMAIEIPEYTAERRIRLDPGIGMPDDKVVLTRIRFGTM